MNPENDAAIASPGDASATARSSHVRIDEVGHARADAHAVVDVKDGVYADIDKEGWLAGAERRRSPSQDARPPATDIDLLVIHNISLPPGDFAGDWIDDLFLDRLDPAAHPYFREIAGLRVSAHLLIRRNGRLLQYVPFEQRAWHAGVSWFAGQGHCNDYSIGIELEGTDDIPFTEAQYARLAECTRQIFLRYPGITEDRIAGHADIAPGRKTDPGPAFDWDRYRQSIRGEDRAVDPDMPAE